VPTPPRAWPLVLVGALYVWMIVTAVVVTALVWDRPALRALLAMGWGIIALWITLAGGLMWRYRDALRRGLIALRGPPRLKFFLACVTLALIEEAVTTGMTNLAPAFGVEMGQAYVTASANYLDVIALHSVVILLPMFAAWTWLVFRWRFHALEAFLLFGIVGIYAEKHLAEFAFWIFVYGLMVWLPAYALPERAELPRPRWFHYGLAVVLPIAAAAPVVYALLASGHPTVHFPPIAP
jgi:hypothetical protein